MVCLELQRERERGGASHFFTSGSEVRDYHKVKMGLSGDEDTLQGKTC